MSSSDPSSFALEAVRRLNHRLDAIQDHLDSNASAFASDKNGAEVKQVAQVEASLSSQLSQSKALPSVKQLEDSLSSLQQASSSSGSLSTILGRKAQNLSTSDVESVTLITLARITYATYTLVLDQLLSQAEAVSDQAWYWQEVEEDVIQTATYFTQTLPARTVNLIRVLSKKLSEAASGPLVKTSTSEREDEGGVKGNIALNTETLRQAWRMVRESPTIAIGALFPLSIQQEGTRDTEARERAEIRSEAPVRRTQLVSAARILTPLGLTRHEARSKRVKLGKERNLMAEQLGSLAQHLSVIEASATSIDVASLHQEITRCMEKMRSTLQAGDKASTTGDLGTYLHYVLRTQLSTQQRRVDTLLSAAPRGLGLPTRLARLWPLLVLGPVTSVFALRAVMQSWDAIVAQASDAKETVRGFFINWVYDPAVKLLDTIRTGDEQGMIVTPESLNSDLQSLERMVSDFSAEQYGLRGEELEAVSKRVREGDLTTVLRIYETELKSPLRSAVSGSLIRALLIQVQKVKVDIAVAMRGVDQLLKSQQLLFGAIGIAPAMGIIYIAGGFLRSRVSIALGGGQGKRAVKTARYRAWEALRRIDRLMSDPSLGVGPLPALTQGLMLLDLTLLRKLSPQIVAQASSSGSGKRATRTKRLRSEFLHDIRDLETTSSVQGGGGERNEEQSALHATATPGLGWHARRAAVDRMWKSWGSFISLEGA